MARWDEQDRYRLAQWGHNCYQQGAYELAERIFAGLVANDPEDGWALKAAGACSIALGRPEECIGRMAQAIEQNPHDGEAWVRLTEAFLAYGDVEKANQAFERARGLSKGWQVARVGLRLRTAQHPPAQHDNWGE